MGFEAAETWQMWPTLLIIVAAVLGYCLERFPNEATSIALLSVLMVFFFAFPVPGTDGENTLAPMNLLSGFANPALIAILALLVIGQGLFQTGAFERPTRWLVNWETRFFTIKIVAVLLVVFVLSAFLNNTPVVVMFIPILSALAASAKKSSSLFLMPLSFICILGGMTTLIGSSTNLLVADSYAKATGGTIGFFDFTIPGLALAFIGGLSVAILAPILLPHRNQKKDSEIELKGKHFIAQIELVPGHPLSGTKSTAGFLPELNQMTVRMIQRSNEVLLPPFEDITLQSGDVVIVAATRQSLTDFFSTHPDYLDVIAAADFDGDKSGTPDDSLSLVEAVIAPGSRMEGRTIGQIGFYHQTNCALLGVQRRSRMIRGRMNDIRLEAGDVLLIAGYADNLATLRSSRDILLLERSATELPTITHANRARIIFLGVILSASTGLLPIVVASVLGATLMVWTGCLNVRQASRAVDRQIFLLVGTALALGLAMEETGAAEYLAMSLVGALSDASVPVILSGFFLLIALLTNVVSNNATAVLMAPIALSTAGQLGMDPLPFLYTVIFAANCSFATPIAYQTNLLVMGPGHYTFGDFVRVGLPLVFVIWFSYTLFIPWYFGLDW